MLSFLELTHTHPASHNSVYLTASDGLGSFLLIDYNTVRDVMYKKVNPVHKNLRCLCNLSDITQLLSIAWQLIGYKS